MNHFFRLIFITIILTSNYALAIDEGDGAPPPSDPIQGNDASADSEVGKSKSPDVPESEDFSPTPFTEYGEFNEAEDEAETTHFFQHGRFFGVSIGSGVESALGNRGALWTGGFPMIAFRFHYWFDFNFALQFGFYTATHEYYFDEDFTQGVDVSSAHLGFAFKYYIPTENLSSAITFAGPFLVVGGGNYRKIEESDVAATPATDDVFALNAGLGLEFPISHKSTYFFIEGLIHFPLFNDRFSDEFVTSRNIPDLSGSLYTITGNILFTW